MSRDGSRGRTRAIAAAVVAAALAAGLAASSAMAGGDVYMPMPVNVKIPDGKKAAKATIPVEASGEINNMFLGTRVTHPQTRDLMLTLKSPDGTLTTLSDRETKGQDLGSGTDCGSPLTMFAYNASTELSEGTAPYGSTFAPSEPFAGLIGSSVTGDWTLKVKDLKKGNHGRLRCFLISFYLTM